MCKYRVHTTLLLLLIAPFFLAACGGTQEPIYSIVKEPTLTVGEPIPLPAEKEILTISGKIDAPNQDDHILMDLATIESAGLVEYSVMDPFRDESVLYTGVLMRDLLDLWQVDEDATTLSLIALNDYQIDIPIQLMRDYPILFAIQADGDYMPITDKGPAMIVLPYDHYEFDQPSSHSYWIWQIKSIDVY